MLLGTFIRILTSLIRDFCTSDRNFASTFFQIPPHDGHPWSWLVVGHCDYNPHNRLSLSRYMPCPAYPKVQTTFDCLDSFFLMRTKKDWNFHPAFDIRIILRFYHFHPHPCLMHLDVLEVLASLILYLLEQQ